jgi:hypothetical protein
VVLALVVGLLAAPLASRSLVRRRRWRKAEGGAARAEAAWADLLEQVGDLGVRVPPSETPRQVGRRLVAGFSSTEGIGDGGPPSARDERGPAVERLVDAVEGARYGSAGGGRGGTALADDVRTVVGAVVAQRPRSATWRWRALPPSGVAHLRRWASSLLRRH